jgi:putative hydrolase of the HAD superfamily
MSHATITHLFLDSGGVLLTNGWDRSLRKLVARQFGVDQAEMDERHHLTYDTYESGKMSLAAYLERVLFYEPRAFTFQEVFDFITGQARPYQDMIDLVRGLKARYGLKVALLSNEGREITSDRVKRFQMAEYVDFFIVSAFVHFRKPDLDIYRVALDIAHAEPERVAYVDDRHMFVEVASTLGIHSICHMGFESTRAALGELGLKL